MRVKDILTIIEQNEWYKKRIEFYKNRLGLKNLGEVLEHNYKKWLEMEISEVKNEQ